MQEAFGIVLFAVIGIGAVVAVVALLGSRRLYDQIGRGGLFLERDAQRSSAAGSPTTALERDQEIRQLLTARNERRRRRGEAELDIEAEMARLAAPATDPGLVAEVRDLVIARNERRQRAGKPALDVEAEVARQLRDLGA